MRRIGEEILELCYWLQFLFLLLVFWALLTFIFDLAGLNELKWIAAQPWKNVLLYLLAALSLIACLHFLLLILRARKLRGMMRESSPAGEVRVSPGALKKLIREALAEMSLEGVRLRLRPGRKGLKIIVELRKARPGLLDTASELQRLLKKRVEFGAGIKVNRVEVHARSLQGEAGEPPVPEEVAQKGESDSPQ